MPSDPIAPLVVETPERRAFYERISRQNLTPLWLPLEPGAQPLTVDPVQEALHLFREERRDA